MMDIDALGCKHDRQGMEELRECSSITSEHFRGGQNADTSVVWDGVWGSLIKRFQKMSALCGEINMFENI